MLPVCGGVNTVLMSGHIGPILYCEETVTREKKFRYCLKIIKNEESIGKSKSIDFIHLKFDKESGKCNLNIFAEKKIHDHVDNVVSTMERCHRNIMWNIYIGKTPITKYTASSNSDDEKNVEDILAEKFSISNPLTWSKTIMADVETFLHNREIQVDGIVGVLAIDDDDVDVAENIIKTTTKYCSNKFGTRLCKDVSNGTNNRKNKLSCGGKKGVDTLGFMIYIGYQYMTSVTTAQILSQTLLDRVDMVMKRRQVLRYLQNMGLSPYHEDRLRRILLRLHPVLTKHQTEIFTSLVQVSCPLYPKINGSSSTNSSIGSQGKSSNNWKNHHNLDEKMINITVVKCGRRDFTVSKRECQCYARKTSLENKLDNTNSI